MIYTNEPCEPPDESDMDDPLIAGLHPSEWPTLDDLLAATAEREPIIFYDPDSGCIRLGEES